MGRFADLVAPARVSAGPAPGPMDDYWYTGRGQASVAGVRVTGDTAMKVSAVYACVDLLSSLVGMIGMHLYRRGSDGSKTIAVDHPLYDVLATAPNDWQTASEFRSQMMMHVLLRGNGYAAIVPGPRGFADHLVPLHPDRMQVVRATDNPADPSLLYVYTASNGARVPYNGDEVFHLRNLSADGVTGLSVLQAAREAIGLGLAAESYGNRFFSQGSTPAGIIRHPGRMSAQGAKRLRSEWAELHSGLVNAFAPAVLEEGASFESISIKPEDAQMIATREFSVADVSRFFRVPLPLLNAMEKVTSWGTGLEAQNIGFVTFTLQRWLVMWTEVVKRDLILAKQLYFADFDTDMLLRGDTAARYASYAVGRQWGFLSANDIRRRERMDPIGPAGDIYLTPVNMATAGSQPNTAPNPAPPPGRAALPAASSRAVAIVAETAARLARKEATALPRIIARVGGDEAALRAAVGQFYASHVGAVARALQVGEDVAREYCEAEAARVLAIGLADGDDIRRTTTLMAMTTGGWTE